MKATLEFDMNDPEDRMEHLRCTKAYDMAQLLWQIRLNLRKRVYHEAEANEFANPNTDYNSGIELVLNNLNDLFEEYDINVEHLTN